MNGKQQWKQWIISWPHAYPHCNIFKNAKSFCPIVEKEKKQETEINAGQACVTLWKPPVLSLKRHESIFSYVRPTTNMSVCVSSFSIDPEYLKKATFTPSYV